MASSTITKFAHLQIPLEDLVKATNNFDTNNIISQGDFGPAYKGQLLHSGELINIIARRLDRRHGVGDVEFWTEVTVLSDLKHSNIVSMIGYCHEKDEKIIITTHQAKGSLKEYLSSPNLTWTQRLKISVGVARALSYLHYDEARSYGVIHRNINSSTILLDENWEAKLSGFEISIKQAVNRTDRVLLCVPIGTIGYMEPETEKSGGVTLKSDIYSFGVVLFEILCGRNAFVQKSDDRLLAPLVKYHCEKKTLKEIIHHDIWNDQVCLQSIIKYSKVAYSCLKEREHRPEMDTIVAKLEKALELQFHRENLIKNLEHLKIPLDDIKSATNNFSDTYRVTSTCHHSCFRAELKGFDKEKYSPVKRKSEGKLSKKHNIVTITRFLLRDDEHEEKRFFTEIEMLTSVKHQNIITLEGFCVEGSEMILVTENVSNGYLSDYLGKVKDRSVFTWEKRLKLCIDVARTLTYLHSKMGHKKVIIHGGIRSHNIGLDDNLGIKIGGFKDAVFLPPNQEDGALYRKKISYLNYYIDPEYKEVGKLRRGSNVYSFGVVLFEILCGRFAYDPIYFKKNDKGLAFVARQYFNTGTLKYLIDPIIKSEIDENYSPLNKGPNKDSFETYCKIAYRCVAETQDERPTMKVVLMELEKALCFQENNKESLRMSLGDINIATQNFHDDNCIGGGGSFGKVYKGEVQNSDGFSTIVAKRLDARLGEAGEQQFLNELQILLEYKHENIINLVGYCDEKDEKVIVYEYASRRLDRCLNDASLTWMKRLNICIDVARALDFLHGRAGRGKTAIIHKDIKTANILFNDDWKAKLAGFGLSVIDQEPEYVTNHVWGMLRYFNPLSYVTDYVCRMLGYFDPQTYVADHVSGKLGSFDPLSIKSGSFKESDIYSFGVVLLEILSGRPIMTIHKHEDVVFEPIKGEIVPNALQKFLMIAYQCLHHKREKRPPSKEVLIQLDEALKLQEVNEYVGNEILRPPSQCEIIEKLRHLWIPLSDIKSATNNFSETYKIAFESNYTLYRAKLNRSNEENPSSFLQGTNNPLGRDNVLIRRYPSQEKHFFEALEMHASVKHCNIVTLLGFCPEKPEMILVVDDVSNGFLGAYLENAEDKRLLTWEKRLNICIDVAHALNYLHYEKMIINRDISSYNIGLDENWRAKIAEFGLSVFLPSNEEDETLYLNRILGRSTYTDPDYKNTCKLKRESDVYSFGVVLFEILCGRLAYDPIYFKGGHEWLVSLVRQSYHTRTLEKMIDPKLKEETSENNFLLNIGPNKDSLHTFIEIAYQCVAETQDERPTMKVVVKELEKALLYQKNNKDNPRIPLEYIKHATQNFSDDNHIGGGGFGKVYKGILQDGDRVNIIVAKRLDTRSGQGEKQFLTEIQILLEYKHENIVGLVGYCDEKDEKVIVYEYAPRGSLDRYLNKASLTWIKRLNICIEVASALDFLHGGDGKQAKVIHRDIKAANILLNHDWKAKLADFGLSLISSITQETNYVIEYACGTPGYLDPLYKNSGFLTLESDIYSFGVVLFEILYGKSIHALYEQEGLYLPNFIKNKFEEGKHDEVVFKQIKEEIAPKSLNTFQEIAYKCLHHEREKRPTAKEVLMELEKALKFQITKVD